MCTVSHMEAKGITLSCCVCWQFQCEYEDVKLPCTLCSKKGLQCGKEEKVWRRERCIQGSGSSSENVIESTSIARPEMNKSRFDLNPGPNLTSNSIRTALVLHPIHGHRAENPLTPPPITFSTNSANMPSTYSQSLYVSSPTPLLSHYAICIPQSISSRSNCSSSVDYFLNYHRQTITYADYFQWHDFPKLYSENLFAMTKQSEALLHAIIAFPALIYCCTEACIVEIADAAH